MKFLILSTGKPSQHLTDAIEQLGHTYDAYNPHLMGLYISDKENGYDRIFDSAPERVKPVRLYAKDYDAIITRIGNELLQSLAVLRHLNENLGVYSPQTSMGLMIAHDKFWTCQALSRYGVRTPPSMLAIRPTHSDFAVDLLGLPMVVKQLSGSQGSGVSILESKLSVKTTLESFYKAKVPVKMQRFIKSVGGPTGSVNDIRAIVVGNEVVSVMERGAANGDFRANLSQGGKAVKISLSEDEKKVCINAAKALGLEFAGVDLMRESGKKLYQTDSCYVTEVNGNPGTGIIDVTGHNHFLDLVMFIANRKAKKATAKTQATTDAQPRALSSYPADMIHAGMTPQQTVNAFSGLILNGSTPEKVQALSGLAETILEAASVAGNMPTVDDITKINVDLYLGDDRRYGAYIAQAPASVSAPAINKQGNVLSEASSQALEFFKSIRS